MGSFPAKTRSLDVYGTLGLDELSGDDIPSLEAPQVIPLLATILDKLIKKNEKSLKSSRKKSSLSSITSFHGLRAPTLGVLQYLERISKYARCSPSCFVIAFIYIERYIERKTSFLTSLNVHRLLITSVVLAAKFLDDACFNNAHYAKIGGISTKEMNSLEMEFLFSLDFRLHVTLDTFDEYCLQFLKEAPRSCCQIERPVQVCGRKGRWGGKDEPKCTPKFAAYTCRAI